ncbi:hypothetical protein AB0L85_31590, partial [Streptomyces sp. NPDC052051]|uniref:hypothetical protein n=1 Tax=Streptomyces sp. NPDC052051 TaxID=3154649 RepID=UPI0034166E6C
PGPASLVTGLLSPAVRSHPWSEVPGTPGTGRRVVPDADGCAAEDGYRVGAPRKTAIQRP